MTLWQKIKRHFCRHECSFKTLRREIGGDATATCEKCGKVLRGPYGVTLPCRWVQ